MSPTHPLTHNLNAPYTNHLTLHSLRNPMYKIQSGSPEYVHQVVLLRREAVTMSRLHHPNIRRLLGVLTTTDALDGDVMGIVMDLASATLGSYVDREVCERGGIAVVKLVGMMADVARGLQYMHGLSPPLVHCDLKEENILVTVGEAGVIRCQIGDVGEARVSECHDVVHQSIMCGLYVYLIGRSCGVMTASLWLL